MKPLHSNDAALKNHYPDLLTTLNHHPHGSSPFVYTDHTLTFQSPAHISHPYGQIDSSYLINTWLNALDLKDRSLYVLCGLGDGSHIQALLNLPDTSNNRYIVYEPDASWLKTLFSQKDLTSLLSDPRLHLITNSEFSFLESWDISNLSEIAPILYTPLYVTNEATYNAFLKDFGTEVTRYHSLHKSRSQDLSLWQSATFQNLSIFANAPDVKATVGLFKDCPIIMVSAGPSLDQSINFIKKAQGHAIIVAINSAYGALIKNGIKPDITIAGDPRDSTFLGYEGHNTEDVYLCAPFYVNPNVAQAFVGRTFTWSIENHIVDLFYQRNALGLPTPIDEKGTVSASIFALARLWGVSKICLVGQDLCFQPSGQTHSKDSFYADVCYPEVDLAACKHMKPNKSGDPNVLVDDKMYIYLKAFEDLIHQNSSIEVKNASLGVSIKGAEYTNLEEAFTWIGQRNIPSVSQTLSRVCIQENRSENVRIFIDRFIHFFEELLKLSLAAAIHIDQLPPKLAHSSYNTHPGILLAQSYSKEVNRCIDRFSQEYQILAQGKSKELLEHYMHLSKQKVADTPHWDELQKNKHFFWAIVEGAHALLPVLKGI